MTTIRHVTVGDTVFYLFRSSGRGSVIRPAIVTSLADVSKLPRLINLHVFFEADDCEVEDTPVTSSMGTRMEPIRKDMTSHVRMCVEESGSVPPAGRAVWTFRGPS